MTAWIYDAERLFRIAERAALDAEQGEGSRKGQDAALVAVLFSAAAIEGFINEIAELAASGRYRDQDVADKYARVLEEAERQRGSTGLKWQLLSIISRGAPADPGAQPTQDLALLFRIRDGIVHLKPERYETGVEMRHKLVKQLIGRSVVPKEQGTIASFLDELSLPEVARWALDTATAVVRQVVDDMPDGAFKGHVMRNFKHVVPA